LNHSIAGCPLLSILGVVKIPKRFSAPPLGHMCWQQGTVPLTDNSGLLLSLVRRVARQTGAMDDDGLFAVFDSKVWRSAG